LLIEHELYWAVTHGVNNFWLKDQRFGGAGARFFAVGMPKDGQSLNQDWTALRDRWEYSHVGRAGLAIFSLFALAIAATICPL
jgi:hypothetical protein